MATINTEEKSLNSGHVPELVSTSAKLSAITIRADATVAADKVVVADQTTISAIESLQDETKPSESPAIVISANSRDSSPFLTSPGITSSTPTSSTPNGKMSRQAAALLTQPKTPENTRLKQSSGAEPLLNVETEPRSESAMSSISSCASLTRTDSSVSSSPSNTGKSELSKKKFDYGFTATTELVDLENLEARSRDPKTIVDYMKVLGIIAAIPVVVAKDSLTNTFAAKERRRQASEMALDSVMGHCYKSSNLRQLRILTGRHPMKTELRNPLYFVFGNSWGLPNYNKNFSGSGFIARWICEVPDRRPEDPVLLYFHGGGFAMKIAQPQVEYICSLAKILLKRRVSVLALDYTITPFARFPVQRNQALACMAVLQRSCNNILLLGDSCGGNLALSMLLEENNHEVLDHANVTGCVLISPWVDPAASTGSMLTDRDILSLKRLQEMTSGLVSDDQLADPRVTPLRADPAVWKRVLPKNTCMVWGDMECLADQDAEFQKLANISSYFVEKNGTHDCILRGLNPKPCKFITEQLLSWLPEPHNSDPKTPMKSPKSPTEHAHVRISSQNSPPASPIKIAKRSSQMFIRKLSTRRASGSPRKARSPRSSRSQPSSPAKSTHLLVQEA